MKEENIKELKKRINKRNRLIRKLRKRLVIMENYYDSHINQIELLLNK